MQGIGVLGGLLVLLSGGCTSVSWDSASWAALDNAPSWLADEPGHHSAVAWADVDGDGLLDLAVASGEAEAAADRVYRNDGDGNLSLMWTSESGDDTRGLAWGDVDGDGVPELATATHGGPDRLYRFEAGAFVEVWTSEDTDARDVAFADVDGDGTLEAAFSYAGSPTRIFANAGGELGAPVWTGPDSWWVHAIAFGDLDGDGLPELAEACVDAPTRVFSNTDGDFGAAPLWAEATPGKGRDVVWLDADGDGRLDLMTVHGGTEQENSDAECQLVWGSACEGANRIHRNLGATLASDSYWHEAPLPTAGVAVGDLNGDDRPDLVVGNLENERSFVYPNNSDDPSARFGAPSDLMAWDGIAYESIPSVALADVDGDGQLDLARGTTASEGVALHRGHAPMFAPGWQSAESTDGRSVDLADYDNDGDLDLLTAGFGEPIRIYETSGGVLGSTAAWQSADSWDSAGAVFLQLDGIDDADSDLDILALQAAARPLRFLEPTLTTQPVGVTNDGVDRTCLLAGDVDYDGDVDYVACTGSDEVADFLQRNTPGRVNPFTTNNTPAPHGQTRGGALGDVDRNGTLDLAVARDGGPFRVYTYGDQAWDLAWSTPDAHPGRAVAWLDLDGDGYPELVTASGNAEPLRLYRNDAGTLDAAPAWESDGGFNALSLAVGDVDGDGDADLAVGVDEQPDRLWENEGGTLVFRGTLPTTYLANKATTSMAFGDIDGDGDLDLARSTVGAPDEVLINTRLGGGSRPNGPSRAAVRGPWRAAANPAAVVGSVTSEAVPLTVTLRDPESDPVVDLALDWSPGPGSAYRPASTLNALTGPFETSPSGVEHLLTWDARRDGAVGVAVSLRARIVRQSQRSVAFPIQHGGVVGVTGRFAIDACGAGNRDVDNDGVPCGLDCDDEDERRHPGAEPICDGVDNDCDLEVDLEGLDVDADGDGVLLCDGDCDDTDAARLLGADEVCDGLDNDCDPDTDLDGADTDGDGDGFLPCFDDCDDQDATIHPGADETCGDGVDEDCDGIETADRDDPECLLEAGCTCSTGSPAPPSLLLLLLSPLLARRRA